MPIIQKQISPKFAKKKKSNFDDFFFQNSLNLLQCFKKVSHQKKDGKWKNLQIVWKWNAFSLGEKLYSSLFFLERDGKNSHILRGKKRGHILPYLDIEFLEVGMILEIFYFIFWPLAKFGYKSERKIQIFWQPAIVWRPVGTSGLNMAISNPSFFQIWRLCGIFLNQLFQNFNRLKTS